MEHCKTPRNPSELVAAHPAHAGWHNAAAHLGWWMPKRTEPHWELLSSWEMYQQHTGWQKTRFAIDPACSQAQGVTIKVIPVLPEVQKSHWGGSGNALMMTQRTRFTGVHQKGADLQLWSLTGKGNHELSFDTSCSDFCMLDSAHQRKPCCCLD